jgi:hypothetical protein
MVTGGVRLGKGRAQCALLLLGQQRRTRLRMTALVAHTVGSRPGVAARDLADPIRGVPRHARNGGGGQSTRQEPQKLPAATLDGAKALAIALMQFEVGQIGMEADRDGGGCVWACPGSTPVPRDAVSGMPA